MSKFIGQFVTYIKEFLKFDIHCEVFNSSESDTAIRHIIMLSKADIYIGSFIITNNFVHEFLPTLLHDGISIFAAKFDSLITFGTLISIFHLKLWIALLAILFICNMCLFLTFEASPSLKNHPKVKRKNMTAFFRIMSFDRFLAAQSMVGINA